MPDRVATPKQTAGGGFAFEDRAVGYYLVWMLSGTAPLGMTGPIERIDCQVAADGWDGFDDLLITMKHGAERHRLALSMKSNLQFTKHAAPSTVVAAAWNLLLHRLSEVMDAERDGFGLICAPHPDPPKVAIQSLLVKARRQTPKQLAERLPVSGYAGAVERDIHMSCTCPREIATGLRKEDSLPGRILKRMSVIELDLENVDSSAEATARFICAELTENKSATNATNLWHALCGIAQKIRTAGGGITRGELIHKVRTIVQLRDFPDFARDWEKLHAWRKAELDAIPDMVAGTTAVNRDDVSAEIVSVFRSSRFVAVVGASGTGKSVVAKTLAEEYGEEGNVLWLRGERVRAGYVEKLASHHQLDHPLQEVLSNGKREGGLVVLDSGERLLDEADFGEMCSLLKMLSMHEEGCGWRLLVTCREEAWGRAQHGLSRAFGHVMGWCPVRVDYPTFEMLLPIWEAFPALRTLAVRPHLSQVTRNLKVLDLLASAAVAGQNPDGGSWVGESQMITWYWQHMVRDGSKGAQRDVLLQRLAIENGDRGRFETLETQLSADDLEVTAESSHLLRTEAERGTVSFVHDLIADWARFRALVAHSDDLASYCEDRFTNPHWHTALRLYGVSLLEADNTGERWRAAIAAYPDGRDCLLEAIMFAGNSGGLIDGVWPVLVADYGVLVNAFLKRFQHIASIPNPEYMALAMHVGGEATEARTWERIPLWMYWLGILPALATHKEDLLALASTETARLARTWLRHTPKAWPGRQHAAALALGVAGQALRSGGYHHHSDENVRLPYTALLEAYPDEPDAVRDLLLKAAARVEPTSEDGKLFEKYEPPGTVTHIRSIISGGRTRVAQEPWPDGPLYRVDDAFRGACFETDAMRGIMADAPDLAREIVLALLIECRPTKMDHDYHSRESTLPEDEVCLVHDHGFYPRFYTRGPFMLFLRTKPRAALQTIICLIDFATERWMESRYEEEDRGIGLDLPFASGEKRFIGDADVFHWYHEASCSYIASSALMAVEKWMYECREREEDITQWVELILGCSRSMAFLGMLCEVGRYAPGLFVGPLRPLILVPETYYMETMYAWKGGLQFGTPASIREGEWFFNLARGWDSMEHRKRRLVEIASCLFHRHEETREALLSARESWGNAAREGDERWCQHTQALIATFNQENWKHVELPDGSKGLAFEEPEHLKTPPDKLAQSEKQMLLLTLPMTCRKMIDAGSGLNDEEIPAFVKRSRDLVGFEPEDKDAARIAPAAGTLLGTAAVLFLLHRDWLRNNPAEESWCLEILDQTLAAPPPWPEFDMPQSVGNHDWEHFASEIAAVIWSESPREELARERVFHLAFAKHYTAAGALLRRAFERREELGDGFWQLVNLVLEWAAIRWEIRDAEYSDEKPDFTEWASQTRERFVAGEFEVEMPDWGERSLLKGKLWAANNHPRYSGKGDVHLLTRIPRIDAQQIQATFAAMFLPAQAADDAERARFFEFWDQALVVCLAGTRFYDEKGHEIPSTLTEAGLPYDLDNWVLERLAVVVGQMRPEEKSERFWQPILALGARSEHWVDRFLDHWFMDAKKTMAPAAFVGEWKRMIDFCLASEAWSVQGGRAGFDLPSLWMSLMGLPRFTTSLWQDDDAAMVEEAGAHYAKVAGHVLRSAHNAVHFLSWLTEASAKGIRRQLLEPIAELGLAASDSWWRERHLPKVMARYMGLVWDEHAVALKRDTKLKKIFLSLVHRVAGTHDSLALELQTRIAQGERPQ